MSGHDSSEICDDSGRADLQPSGAFPALSSVKCREPCLCPQIGLDKERAIQCTSCCMLGSNQSYSRNREGEASRGNCQYLDGLHERQAEKTHCVKDIFLGRVAA